MSRLPILRAVVLAAPLLLASGCASLGGNVKGSFACRAPEGTCAPTSSIDAGATGIEKADTVDAHRTVPPTGEAVRRLQVVLTPYRDAAGRDHEARVVHLTPVSYTHLRAHETPEHLVCRLLLEKKNI